MLAAGKSKPKVAVVPPQKLIEQAESASNSAGIRVIPDNVTLPPPSILWHWLSYIYHTTGEWWLPPKTPLSAINPPETFPPAITLEQETETSLSPYTRRSGKTLNSLTKGRTTPEKKTAFTRFDYHNSAYFAAAQQILDKYVSGQTAGTNLNRKAEVLAFILAWSCHPFFNSKIAGRNSERWMTMSRQRCARELQIRPQDFIETCDWLETQHIIETGEPVGGIITPETFNQFLLNVQKEADSPLVQEYWPGRALTNRIKIYRLQVELPDEINLPVFDYLELTEFSSATQNPVAGKLTLVNSLNRESLSQFETEKGKVFSENFETTNPSRKSNNNFASVGKDFPRPFPAKNTQNYEQVAHDHEIHINKESDLEKENHENHAASDCSIGEQIAETEKTIATEADKTNLQVMSSEEVELNSEQLAKLNFLKHTARFEGFEGAKGRITVDYNPALKLACHPALSLESLQKIYQQVHLRWIKGELENPVGYFHASLKNFCDNAGKQSLLPPLENTQENTRKGLKATRIRNNRRKAAASWEAVANSTMPKSDGLDQEECNLPSSRTAHHFDTGWRTLAQNKILASETWEQIKQEDLPGRFRLSSDNLRPLEGSAMSVELTTPETAEKVSPKVVITLRSELELKTLDYQLKNLIRMVLSQRFGPGYDLEFVC